MLIMLNIIYYACICIYTWRASPGRKFQIKTIGAKLSQKRHNRFQQVHQLGYPHLGMDQYLLTPFLGGWTSIYIHLPAILGFTRGTRVLTYPLALGFPNLFPLAAMARHGRVSRFWTATEVAKWRSSASSASPQRSPRWVVGDSQTWRPRRGSKNATGFPGSLGFFFSWMMVWNGMKWYEMVWNGMKWYEMVWNGMKWYEMVWNGMNQWESWEDGWIWDVSNFINIFASKVRGVGQRIMGGSMI